LIQAPHIQLTDRYVSSCSFGVVWW